MIIQIIGLPGVGKTHAIKEYLENTNLDIRHIDYAKYNSDTNTRKINLKRDIFKVRNKNIIVESACGLNIKGSIIIKYKKDIQEVYANFLKREKYIDTEYMSLLQEETIKPNYTVKNKKTMHTLFDYFFS